jgi:hypothetical protein
LLYATIPGAFIMIVASAVVEFLTLCIGFNPAQKLKRIQGLFPVNPF